MSILPSTFKGHRQDVVQLNTQGIQCLDRGMFREACASFRLALREISDRMRENDRSWLMDLSRTLFAPYPIIINNNGPSSSHNIVCLHTSPFQLTRIQNSRTRSSSPSSSSSEEGSERSSNSSINNVVAVLLYNVGLSQHLMAEQLCIKDCHFQQALKMYEMATEALYREECCVEAMEESRRRVLLAIYNNQAHARCHLLEFPACTSCLEALRYVLSFCTVSDEDHHYQDFLMNCLCAQGQEIRSAPAA
ncbi:hypothetical protein ACA910_009762 [Epithemia clementina (nom. ined.)]